MCHALLYSPGFLAMLLHIDQEFAQQARELGCPCSGALHRSDYPRKPRDCPAAVRAQHCTRLSFCCAVCRRRVTPQSVRFLARRVYLALTVVLVSARPAGPTPAAAALGAALGVTRHTLARWRQWWVQRFPGTGLWRVACAQFMPPLAQASLPGALIERFGDSTQALMRLLHWLSPISVAGSSAAATVTLPDAA